jgi:hypothetical protein
MNDQLEDDQIERRKAYGEDFAETVAPWNDIAIRFVGYSVEYGNETRWVKKLKRSTNRSPRRASYSRA